jgi:hypothetical protein
MRRGLGCWEREVTSKRLFFVQNRRTEERLEPQEPFFLRAVIDRIGPGAFELVQLIITGRQAHHMAGIGHNKGPQQHLGLGWQKYCWGQARRDLLGKHIPMEVVRRRVMRARELGLAYPQYASILLGTGRDVVGFLFTTDGLQLRLQRALEMPDVVKQKLLGLKACQLMSFAPSGEHPETFRRELNVISDLDFCASGPEPERAVSWDQARRAIRGVLDPLQLPSDAVVMIGTCEAQQHWAMSGKLARFIPSKSYFPETEQ